MPRITTISPLLKYVSVCSLIAILLSGCNTLRPDRALPLKDPSQAFKAPTMMPTPTVAVPLSTPQNDQIENCTNNLVFLEDLTVPDWTQVSPGTVLDKEWKVKNSGTCNWNETYSIRLVSGPDLGVASPQALIPARNGAEAVIRVSITAPADPGKYSSTWQAYSADGQPFGEWFSVAIVVITP
jgi:hypothetical protein